MADHRIGKVYIELDLDPKRYMRSQQTLLKEAQHGATVLEKNFKNLGIKSGATFDLMRAQAQKSFDAIKKSGRATSEDIIRAEKAKAERIKQLNEQQYGHTTSMFENIKKHWMGVTAAIVAGWYAVSKAIRKASDVVLAAARYETLGIVMRVVGQNAGYTGEQMMIFQKGLEKTGIAMIEARETLSRMLQAQMNLTHATKLARIAQDAAVIGNMNSSEAFQQMIYGIQSANVRVLRTIGINVSWEQSYAKLAQRLGRTTNTLTEFEKINARTNAVLERGVTITGTYEAAMETAGKQLLSLERHFSNLRVLAGEAFTPALAEVIENITTSITGLNEELSGESRDKIHDWGIGFRITLIYIEAEIMRLSMLIDKMGGTLTWIPIALTAVGSALGVESSKKRFEEWAQRNLDLEERYKATEQKLIALAEKLLKLENSLTATGKKRTKEKLDAIEKERIAQVEEQKILKAIEAIKAKIAKKEVEQAERNIKAVDILWKKEVDRANEIGTLTNMEQKDQEELWQTTLDLMNQVNAAYETFRQASEAVGIDYKFNFDETASDLETLTLLTEGWANELAWIANIMKEIEGGTNINIKSSLSTNERLTGFLNSIQGSGEVWKKEVTESGDVWKKEIVHTSALFGSATGETIIAILGALEQYVTLPIRMLDAGSSLLDAVGTFPEKLMEAAETFVTKLVLLAPQFVASMIAAIGNFGDIATSTWQGMFGTGGTFGAGSYVRGSIGANVNLLSGQLTPVVSLSQNQQQIISMLESELGATVDAASTLAHEFVNMGIMTTDELENASATLQQLFRSGMAIDVENWDRWVAEVLAGDIANFEQAIADALSAGIADLSNRITTSDEFGLLSDAMQEQIKAMFGAENLDLTAIGEFLDYWEELTGLWENVTESIAEMTGQLSSLDSQVLSIHHRFDDWVDQLRELGVSEETLAGIREQENVAILHLIDTQREAFEAGLTSRMARLTFAEQPGRLAAYEGTRGFIEAIEQIREWSEITGEGYEDLIAQTVEVYQLEMEAAIEQSAAAQELQAAADEWTDVAKSLEKNIFALQTSLANPEDVLGRMSTVWDEITRLEAEGADTPEEIQKLQELYNQYLELAQEAYQRPSNEYQNIYNTVIAALSDLRDDAEDFASSYELQRDTYIAEQLQLTTQQGMALSLEEIAANIMAGIPVDIALTTDDFVVTIPDVNVGVTIPDIVLPTIPPIEIPDVNVDVSVNEQLIREQKDVLEQIRRNIYQVAVNTYWAGAATGLPLYAEKGGIFSGPDTGYPVIFHGIEEAIPLDNRYTRTQVGKDYPEINLTIHINESKTPRETGREVRREVEGLLRSDIGRKLIQHTAAGR